MIEFKNSIKIISLPPTSTNELLEHVFEYPHLVLVADDFKTSKPKIDIPLAERCVANRVSGEQCTRRKTKSSQYCGTHNKSSIHGDATDPATNAAADNLQRQAVEVFAEEIQGIVYYIDHENNVYNTEDIVEGRVNPRVIATIHRKGTTVVEAMEWLTTPK